MELSSEVIATLFLRAPIRDDVIDFVASIPPDEFLDICATIPDSQLLTLIRNFPFHALYSRITWMPDAHRKLIERVLTIPAGEIIDATLQANNQAAWQLYGPMTDEERESIFSKVPDDEVIRFMFQILGGSLSGKAYTDLLSRAIDVDQEQYYDEDLLKYLPPDTSDDAASGSRASADNDDEYYEDDEDDFFAPNYPITPEFFAQLVSAQLLSPTGTNVQQV